MRRLLTSLLLLILVTNAHAELILEGLDEEQESNVRAWLTIGRMPETTSRSALYRHHRRARGEIRTALQALGHYRPEIDAKLELRDDGFTARYRIQPGPRSVVRQQLVRFRGEGAPALQETLQLPQLQDRPLDHAAYGALKDKLLNAALTDGFLDAELVVSRLLVDPSRHSADIELELDTGPRYHFGRIEIRQEILDPAFLANYVHVESGEPFSSSRLLELQLRLTDLDYFDSLEVQTERRDGEQALVDVVIETTPRPPQRYQFGVGFGTDTGPRVSAATEFRRLNRRGHRLRNQARIAETQQQISAQYLIPTGREIGANWSLQSRYELEKFADADSEEFQIGLARTAVAGAQLWQFFLNYQLENFTVGQTRSQTELLVPGISLTIRQADDSLNPRRGYKLFGELKGAHSDYASSDSFVRSLVQARTILPLGMRSRLLLRGQLGYSLVGEISELPLSQRFFAGGDQSVRGYAYQTLGPVNDRGDVIGGKYLSVASVELDHLFRGDYGAALFYDYGGATDAPLQGLSRGVGVGFRWRTAIGMLRVDLAHPLDHPEDRLRLHVGFGAEL